MFRVHSCCHQSPTGLPERVCAGWGGSVRPRGHVSDLQSVYKIWQDSGYKEQAKERKRTQTRCKSSDFLCALKAETRLGFLSLAPGGLFMGVRVDAAQWSHLQCHTFAFGLC